MKPNQTVTALMARGFDSKLAGSLAKRGYSLSKLKQHTVPQLKELGISDELAGEVQNGTRPPVPTETVNKLLYESRSICCMCRENGKPIILHHINPWHKSRSHDENNLIALCLNCHGDVHTRRELSLNITPARLRDHKSRWLAEVRADTLKQRMTPSAGQFGMAVWDYFNHDRILDAAIACEVRIQDAKRYKEFLEDGLISRNGAIHLPLSRRRQQQYCYLYDVINRQVIAFYQSVLMTTLARLPIVDLTEAWNRSTVNLLESGAAVIFAGGWRFKKHKRNGPGHGPGQMRTGYVQKRGIRLKFDFDGWEATSTSSWGHLAGSWSCTGICIVRSVERNGKLLVIQATALAIGTGFKLPP